MLCVRVVHTCKMWQFFASHPVIHRHCRRSHSLLSSFAIPKYLELHVRRLLPKLSHLCDPQGLGMCVIGLQCGRYKGRKNPVQELVTYASVHGYSFTHEKISQQQYSTLGNYVSSFLQTNSNSKDPGLCVYVRWGRLQWLHSSVSIHCVSRSRRYLGCCDETYMNWNPLQMEWGMPMMTWSVTIQLFISSATVAAKDLTWRVLITDCNKISHTSSHSEKHPLWMASQEHTLILAWEPVSGGCLDVGTHFSGLWRVEQNERTYNERTCLAP